MIIVFDLDDTLYDEKTYFLSGLQAICKNIAFLQSIPEREVLDRAKVLLENGGREKILDRLLLEYGNFSSKNVRHLLAIYRKHKPSISLAIEDRRVIQLLSENHPLYLVTDGNKLVQRKKIEALEIRQYFKKVFITHQYGISASKPSLFCFERIIKGEKNDWDKLVYVGDDPKKDFVNLNALGAVTVRIMRGRYSNVDVGEAFDGKIKIYNLKELLTIFLDSEVTYRI